MDNKQRFWMMVLPALLWLGLSVPTAATEPINIGSRLEPLIDDYLIEKLEKYKRRRLYQQKD